MEKIAKALAVLACTLAADMIGGQSFAAPPEVRAPALPAHVQPGAAPLPERRMHEEKDAGAAAAKGAEGEAAVRAADADRRARQDAFRAEMRRRIDEASRLSPGVQPDGSVVVRGADGSVRITRKTVRAPADAGKTFEKNLKKH